MTGLEIALFILGVAFIVISFFIVDNSKSGNGSGMSASSINTEAIRRIGADAIEDMNRRSDLLIAESEDKLETISNDKIIAVGEYSDQVLEKINSNHKEVVFLYQMLNEKEEELKATAIKLENVRIECEKLIQSEVALEVHRSNKSMSERMEEKAEDTEFQFSSYLGSTYQDMALQNANSPEAALKDLVRQSTEPDSIMIDIPDDVTGTEEFDFSEDISEISGLPEDSADSSKDTLIDDLLDSFSDKSANQANDPGHELSDNGKGSFDRSDDTVSKDSTVNEVLPDKETLKDTSSDIKKTEESAFEAKKEEDGRKNADVSGNEQITTVSAVNTDDNKSSETGGAARKISDEDRRRALESANRRRATAQKRADDANSQNNKAGAGVMTGLERASRNKNAAESDITAASTVKSAAASTIASKSAAEIRNQTAKVQSAAANDRTALSQAADVKANTVRRPAADAKDGTVKKPVADVKDSTVKRTVADVKDSTVKRTVADVKDGSVKRTVADVKDGTVKRPAADTKDSTVKRPAADAKDITAKRTVGETTDKATARRKPVQTSNTPVIEAEGRDNASLRRNEEIISLHRQGRSVMEISKLLRMGQGEVRLIINLYG
ncbi:MAG: hypothetical protein J5824_05005 [Lachnospiraceae bacterium]|nr:hypothetical protein [Lachnospiraceae bacterium]